MKDKQKNGQKTTKHPPSIPHEMLLHRRAGQQKLKRRLTGSDTIQRKDLSDEPMPPGYEDCWIWRGEKNKDGFGIIRISYEQRKSKREMIHRVAWKFWYQKDIPKDTYVQQTCGNKACCNPKHLKLASIGELRRHANIVAWATTRAHQRKEARHQPSQPWGDNDTSPSPAPPESEDRRSCKDRDDPDGPIFADDLDTLP